MWLWSWTASRTTTLPSDGEQKVRAILYESLQMQFLRTSTLSKFGSKFGPVAGVGTLARVQFWTARVNLGPGDRGGHEAFDHVRWRRRSRQSRPWSPNGTRDFPHVLVSVKVGPGPPSISIPIR